MDLRLRAVVWGLGAGYCRVAPGNEFTLDRHAKSQVAFQPADRSPLLFIGFGDFEIDGVRLRIAALMALVQWDCRENIWYLG